ncbi:MAG: hypothetical protein ABEJ06_02420 [Haloarculaceae archaeon]
MTDRGQFVLAAAAVVVLALAPVVLAYLQLGAHPDVRAASDYDSPTTNAEHVLERAVHEAGVGLPATHPWAARERAVAAVRADVDRTREVLRRSRVAEGVVYQTRYNDTAARRFAADRCPHGPARHFGPCRASRGIVVQERVGETHLLAVAVDVTVHTDRGRTELTLVVRAVGGVRRERARAMPALGPGRSP